MKILQVIDFFYPALAHGGTAKAAYCISKDLVKLGHEVTVLTGDGLDRTHRLERGRREVDGVKVTYMRSLSTRIAWDWKLVVLPGFCIGLKQNPGVYDIIHIHNIYSLQNAVAFRFAMRAHIPYVVQAHGSLRSDSSRQLAKRIYFGLSGRSMIRHAAKGIAITENEEADYLRLGLSKERIATLPTGIDLSEFKTLPQKGAFRRSIGVNLDEQIILYVGRLHAAKGLDFLISSFATVHEQVPNVKLVLAGPDDGYSNQIKKMVETLGVKESVIMTGFLDEETKKSALVDADVFATPSYAGFPATFLEACACGIPIVTTTNGDELTWIDGQTGIVSEYDIKAYANAMCLLLNDKAMRKRLGENGKRAVALEFDWRRIARKLEATYLECTQ